MEKSSLPLIVNMNIAQPLMQCYQLIEFIRAPVVGPWRKYELNQTLIPDHLCISGFQMRVCNQGYKALKFDNADIRNACERWDSFEASFLDSAQSSLEHTWQCYVLNAMVLEAHRCNKNNNAGLHGDIDLGAPGAPRVITGDNIAVELAKLQRVLVEQNMWQDGKMFIRVPPAIREALVSSPYANALQMGSCVDCSILVTGELPGTIAGFNVYVTNDLPTVIINGKPAYYIIAGMADAFAFAGDIVESRIVQPTTSFSVEYQMQALWGGKAIYPEGLAIGLWTLG